MSPGRRRSRCGMRLPRRSRLRVVMPVDLQTAPAAVCHPSCVPVPRTGTGDPGHRTIQATPIASGQPPGFSQRPWPCLGIFHAGRREADDPAKASQRPCPDVGVIFLARSSTARVRAPGGLPGGFRFADVRSSPRFLAARPRTSWAVLSWAAQNSRCDGPGAPASRSGVLGGHPAQPAAAAHHAVGQARVARNTGRSRRSADTVRHRAAGAVRAAQARDTSGWPDSTPCCGCGRPLRAGARAAHPTGTTSQHRMGEAQAATDVEHRRQELHLDSDGPQVERRSEADDVRLRSRDELRQRRDDLRDDLCGVHHGSCSSFRSSEKLRSPGLPASSLAG
jgi:hypothetical protein